MSDTTSKYPYSNSNDVKTSIYLKNRKERIQGMVEGQKRKLGVLTPEEYEALKKRQEAIKLKNQK